MEEIISTVASSPEALVAGAIIGFVAAKLSGRRNTGMGGGF